MWVIVLRDMTSARVRPFNGGADRRSADRRSQRADGRPSGKCKVDYMYLMTCRLFERGTSNLRILPVSLVCYARHTEGTLGTVR